MLTGFFFNKILMKFSQEIKDDCNFLFQSIKEQSSLYSSKKRSVQWGYDGDGGDFVIHFTSSNPFNPHYTFLSLY